MRLLLALAVVVLALVAWLAVTPRDSAPRAAEIGTGSAGPVADGGSTPLDTPSTSDSETRQVEESQTISVSTVPSRPKCRLVGRVVDDLGAPLAGALSNLHGVGEANEELGISGPDGRFVIALAVPTAKEQLLSITAAPFHDSVNLWFGDFRENPRLIAGDVDVGSVKLARTGTIEGRVLTDEGVGIQHVSVRLGRFGRSGFMTDALGRYSISEVVPGHWLLTVSEQRWLTTAETYVDVEALRVTRAPDLTLARAPTIEGIVVDENNSPLSNITISATNAQGQLSDRTRSAFDGRFVLNLREAQRMMLSVNRMYGYRDFGGGFGDPTCTFEPGARDVRIVLAPAPRMTFRIVEAVTRAPIERFGICVQPVHVMGQTGTVSEDALPLQDRPHGEATLPLPGRAYVVVAAPGRAPVEIDVAADVGSSNVQTIALAGASSITGRVRVGEEPIPGAEVSVMRERLKSAGALAPPGGWPYDVDPYPGRLRTTATNDRGEFTLADLAAGTHSVTITGEGGVRRHMSSLVTPLAGVLELGDIALEREAVVRGVVRTVPSESPIGFTITLGDRGESRIQNADGTFEFRGLAAGPTWLVWSRPREYRYPSDSDPRRIPFVLAAGETREFVIDATISAACTLRVEVRRNGSPAREVLLLARDSAREIRDTIFAGTTDVDGGLVKRVDGGMTLALEALSKERRVIGTPPTPIVTVAGQEVSCVIDITSGTVIVELPTTIAPPHWGRVSLVFAKETTYTAHTVLPSDTLVGTRWVTNRIDFGELPAGLFDVEVLIEEYPLESGDNWIALREPWKTTIRIEEGQETRVVVP